MTSNSTTTASRQELPICSDNSEIIHGTFSSLAEALVLNNDNLTVEGRISYLPVYMVMFLEKEKLAAQTYKIELNGLK